MHSEITINVKWHGDTLKTETGIELVQVSTVERYKKYELYSELPDFGIDYSRGSLPAQMPMAQKHAKEWFEKLLNRPVALNVAR